MQEIFPSFFDGINLTPNDLFPVISESLLALACFCVAGGLTWHMHRRKGLAKTYRKVASLALLFAFAGGVSQISAMALSWFPVSAGLIGAAGLVATLLALFAAVALCLKLPARIAPLIRAEKHLHSVLQELTHRSQNLLAIVNGIARQTATSAATLPEFMEGFSARLQTLADAHGLLIEHSWRGVELRALILLETGGDYPPLQNRLIIRGEREIVGPEAAQNLALGLHEMLTNAYRYGALSSPLGSIVIAWQRVKVENRVMLELTWIETGGATVSPPERFGFGRSLIERLVPRAIEGTSQLIFAPEGVRWILHFPIERLGQDA
jgi:two-component sensor histidine kinase